MTPEYSRPFDQLPPAGFRVGNAVSRTFEVFFQNFVPFFAISAVAAAPLFVYGLAQGGSAKPGYAIWVQYALQITLSALCEAMIIYATFQAMRNRPVRPTESIARGLARFGPIIAATILTTAVIAVGYVLLIVPGIIASLMFCVTLPACVVERLGPVDSMKRSSALTSGYRWPIFGAFLVIGIVGAVVAATAAGMLGAIGLASGLAWVVQTALFVWTAVAQAFQSVLVAIIYHDLRVVKEGIDLEQIASVFD